MWTSLTQAGKHQLNDGQDHVPGLLLSFDVPGRLDHFLERVAPVDHRSELAGLDELLDEEDALLCVVRWNGEEDLLVADPRGPQRPENIREPVRRYVGAARLQRTLAP